MSSSSGILREQTDDLLRRKDKHNCAGRDGKFIPSHFISYRMLGIFMRR